MSPFERGLRQWSSGAPVRLAAVVWLALVIALPAVCAQQISSGAGFRDVDLAGYRENLKRLDSLVAHCLEQIQHKASPSALRSACDATGVGPDDRVLSPGTAEPERREVRYDWLRIVLHRANSKDKGTPDLLPGTHAGTQNTIPDARALLDEAAQRLQMDERQAEAPLAANPAYADQRRSLDAILARREYSNVTKISTRERFLEWLGNLINLIVMKLSAIGAQVPWIGRLLEILLVAGACTLLVWLLVRMERNARLHFVPEIENAPKAPSAREWQLWLKDAQDAADNGAWREAIHSVYWASISRLESARLWPADRARTPREYLGLLSGTDPRQSALMALTRSFERTWYGGRTADAAEFNAALDLAAGLGVKAE
ncbi:MAG: DUF4129 domain-containing protein [Terracidiphilus sp.]